MLDPGSESDFSDTSDGTGSSSDSSGSSSSSNESINEIELAKIGNDTLELPKGLCENPAIFKEFFSYKTWSSLPANSQAYLKSKFLPHFPEDNARQQELTLEMLFSDKISRFATSPLMEFQKNLEEGNYRPEVLKLREGIAKSRRREARYQEYERISQVAKNLMISREKLLRKAYNSAPGSELKVDNLIGRTPRLDETFTAVRARKRFHREINEMGSQLGIHDLSDVEDGTVAGEPLVFPPNELLIVGTMARKSEILNRSKTQTGVPLNGNSLRRALLEHKRMKMSEPDRPEFETNDIRLRDVHTRTQIAAGVKKSMITGKTPGRKPKAKLESAEPQPPQPPAPPPPPTPQQLMPLPPPKYPVHSTGNASVPMLSTENSLIHSDSEDEDVNVETISTSTPATTPKIVLNGVPERENPYLGKIKPATMSDLDGIDMMHLPVDLDDSTDISMSVLSDFKPLSMPPAQIPGPELMQETHACFLSLVRDIFCSTPNHRMKLDELKEKISAWLANPITALNDWYTLAENWLSLVPSAINFLAGDYADQPDEFVPYVEFKSQLNIYQWIGAGRDTDNHLLSLCNYWMARKHEMSNKPHQKFDLAPTKSLELEDYMSSDRMASPPPPRCNTSWIVCQALPDEIEEFRLQERIRFENAHKAFTYRQHGYESVVGPVKGIYTQIFHLARAREHNMLIGDRPNFVTILTLVRDATARLPNGEGTRADICELLRCSQYINPEASESVMQTIVSGALDRMHTETDPCVRYDTRRKLWIYLHRNRSEEEFEAIHQQNQGVGKHKKVPNRKVKTKAAKAATAESLLLSQPPMHIVKATVITSSSAPLAMPALSSIQSSSPPTLKFTQPQPPPQPVAPPKPIVKAELVPIKPPTDKIELIELQEPSVVQKSPQMTMKKPPQTLTSPTNSTQIRVATPSGIQTVHVSVANTPTIVSMANTNAAVPKRLTKQIVIGPQTSGQVGQHQQQGFIVPLKINSTEQQPFKIISSIPHANIVGQKMIKTNAGTVINSRSGTVFQAPQQSIKNVRLASPTNPTNKSLLPTAQMSPKLNIQPQVSPIGQKTLGNISIINNVNAPAVGMTVKMPPQTVTNLQQKQQIIQNLLNQPQAKRLITVGGMGQVIQTQPHPHSQQQQQQASNMQPKNVIIQQTAQSQPRIISVSSSGLTTMANTTGQTMATPQIIQIHTAGSQGTPGKIQTINTSNLTPQQQQTLFQTLKQQQQLKTIQGNKVQQSLIIKPAQTTFAQPQQQQQKLQSATNIVSSGMGVCTTPAKTVTSIIQSQSKQIGQQTSMAKTVTVVSQPQTLTRVVQNQIITPGGRAQQTSNPIMAKVLTNNTGQIISLESLLQKQGVAPGTTLRVGNKPGQANLIQLASPTGQQIAQYAVVSQGRNIISMGNATRMVTTQSGATNTVMTSVGNVGATSMPQMSRIQEVKTILNNQSGGKVISANQIQTINAHQLVNAKLISKAPNQAAGTGGIRMINASNFNISNLRGKPMLIASKTGGQQTSTSGGNNSAGGQQNVFIQNPTNVVIGGQTLKLQGNVISPANVQILNQQSGQRATTVSTSSSQPQTMMLGNQIIKLQPNQLKQLSSPQTVIASSLSNITSAVNSPLTTVASTNTGTVVVNSSGSVTQNIPRTVVLGSTGQTVRVQSPHVQMHSNNGPVTGANSMEHQQQAGHSQPIILGTTALKGTPLKTTTAGQQRMVLAVQGGGQIILPANFQGGSINLKSLQGLKVVSLGQQQQNKNKNHQPK